MEKSIKQNTNTIIKWNKVGKIQKAQSTHKEKQTN